MGWEFVYAKSRNIKEVLVLEAKVITMKLGLDYYIENNLLSLTFETDSLILKKILDGIWEVPSSISLEIMRIKHLMGDKSKKMEHIFREGNQLAQPITLCLILQVQLIFSLILFGRSQKQQERLSYWNKLKLLI